MSATTKLVTAADLRAMGEDAPYELIRGELRGVSPTHGWHGLVGGRFVKEFLFYSEKFLPGEVFVAEAGYFAEQDPDTVVAPDVMFFRKDRVPPKDELQKGFVTVPPDAVVEVKSRSNTYAEIEEKVEIYLGSGVPVVLVAIPDRETISVRRRDGSQETLRIGDILDLDDVLPGFRVPVERFFR